MKYNPKFKIFVLIMTHCGHDAIKMLIMIIINNNILIEKINSRL